MTSVKALMLVDILNVIQYFKTFIMHKPPKKQLETLKSGKLINGTIKNSWPPSIEIILNKRNQNGNCLNSQIAVVLHIF